MSVGLQHIMYPFSKAYPKKRQVDANNINKFSDISSILEDLADIQKPFDKFVTSFDKFAVSMGTFATNFNSIDNNKSLSFTGWTKSFMDFSKMNIDDYQENLKVAAENWGFNIDKHLEGFREKTKTVINTESQSVNNTQAQQNNNAALLAEIKGMRAEISSLNSTIAGGIEVDVTNIVRTQDSEFM